MKALLYVRMRLQQVGCVWRANSQRFFREGVGAGLGCCLSPFNSDTILVYIVQGLTPSGQKIRPDTVSGASAGSISAVALNAVLKYTLWLI